MVYIAMAQPIALVTGSRKGIGKFLAQQLVQKGYIVIGCSRQPIDWSLENYEHVIVDVCQENQVQELLQTIRKRFGHLDVTINNAGVAAMNHMLVTPMKTITNVLSINIQGTFLVSRESAKIMRSRNFGRIINLSTIAVPMSLEGEALYVASKGAVENLSKVMSRELAPFGITVNVIGPTPIETDLIKNIPQEKIKTIIDRLAIKRLGKLEDVFNVVEFLIKPESDYITGQVIYLGGA
jgi:3-oxoacyl-[acyl-carrier protein] reductase